MYYKCTKLALCIILHSEGIYCKSTFHHEGPKGEKRHNFTFSLTSVLDVSGWSAPRPGRFTGAHCAEGSPPPDFDPQTVQLVASRCTN